MSLTQAADFMGTNQPQEAGPPECLDRYSWKNSRLIYLTGGRGDYALSFLRYEEVPTHIAQKIIETAQKEREEAKAS